MRIKRMESVHPLSKYISPSPKPFWRIHTRHRVEFCSDRATQLTLCANRQCGMTDEWTGSPKGNNTGHRWSTRGVGGTILRLIRSCKHCTTIMCTSSPSKYSTRVGKVERNMRHEINTQKSLYILNKHVNIY